MQTAMNTTQPQRHFQGVKLLKPLNSHTLDCLIDVARCTDRLIADGYTILGIKIGSGNPRIWIETRAACVKLGGLVYKRSGKGGIPERVMVAVIMGCQVEWIERGP